MATIMPNDPLVSPIGQTITMIEVGHPNRARSTPHVGNDNIIAEISNAQITKIVDGPA
jgi:hypothetical protein